MRLKVKKLLKGGEYFVSFENVDFNPEETEKIEKFGMPTVDFSSDGLGTHKLNEIDVSIKCQSGEEAEQLLNNISAGSAFAALVAATDSVTAVLADSMIGPGFIWQARQKIFVPLTIGATNISAPSGTSTFLSSLSLPSLTQFRTIRV